MTGEHFEKPNLVWITLDSIRHDHTTVGGYDRNTTPNLRAIADRDEATAFDHCIATGNWSLPSAASIHTGMYPSYHGTGYEVNSLPTGITTIPDRLRAVGYRTVGVSANHYFSEATGLDRGFDVFKQIQPSDFFKHAGLRTTLKFLLGIRSHSGGLTTEKSKHRPDYLVNEIVKDELSALATDDQPFFLSAHYHGSHHPYYPPPNEQRRFGDELAIDGTEAADIAFERTADVHEQIARTDEFAETDWAAIRTMYDTLVSCSDKLIGDLFAHLQSLDLENTVFVVTADHGDLLGEYGLLSHKFVLHDGIVRVPMVVFGDDGLFDGADELVQHIDIMRTIVDVAGGETANLHGIDLRSDEREYALSQRGADTEESLSKVREHDPEFDDSVIHSGAVSALRTPSFKYRQSDQRAELFSLPDEATDVSDDRPALVAEFENTLEDKLASIGQADAEMVDTEFSDAAKERLSELGYLVE